jgi:hypothetical protein
MLKECLVCSSMRLGDPFIAPRQLGAVDCIPGRQFLPSVAWRTGQSGAPPNTVRCGSLSLFSEADRCSLGAVGAPDTVRCTPDSPVIYSRTSPSKSREQQVRLSQPGASDSVRCTQTELTSAVHSQFLQIGLFLFSSLRHNTLVSKTMY